MRKAVFKVNLSNDREKNKVMKAVSVISGVDRLSVDMKDGKLTVVGDIDPVTIAIKLRKLNYTDMISFGKEDEEEHEALEGMRKVVFKLHVSTDTEKNRVMKAAVGIPGVDSIAIDMKDQKMTAVGDLDPVLAAGILRKLCYTEIISFGPAKREKEKKEEFKKTEEKEVPEYVKAYIAFNPHMRKIKLAQEDRREGGA